MRTYNVKTIIVITYSLINEGIVEKTGTRFLTGGLHTDKVNNREVRMLPLVISVGNPKFREIFLGFLQIKLYHKFCRLKIKA
ncbi:hypothetical protein T10_142 [Trichinella papuae]|uniref:Uncharacterized protein n=1 Tax=Trichinella papuae TaxID=268474 RepID=A0A0V1MX97_9BILA|nr:hypothetical protein T10_142 [Trichinella papuae]